MAHLGSSMYDRHCVLLALAAACHSPPDDSALWDPTAATDAADPCNDALDHELPVADCAAREPASCQPGLAPQTAASPLLDDIFSECSLNESVLTVQLAQGCAARFSLSGTAPGSVQCVAARLEGQRFDCPGELRCIRGERSTLR